MNECYFEFRPDMIVIRRRGDGEDDPIIAKITPEVLLGMMILAPDVVRSKPIHPNVRELLGGLV